MTTRSAVLPAPGEAVWAVLADGWLYPSWVVGATRMRDVDGHWPSPGSELHHSVGVWPAIINDSTTVLEVEAPHFLRLLARAWPGGEAEVVLRLAAEDEGTRVEMSEKSVRGPATLVPKPVERLLLAWRNDESLRRLGFLASGRAARV